ncbi:MAG TPA: hypothetical protein VM691_05570, partial [Myxococcales bacterium]|nr:hypothetical protein [Myxococcales bacterium]
EAHACGFVTALVDHGDAFARLLEWYRNGLARLSAAALRSAVLAIRRDAEPLLGARLDDLVALYETAVLESHDGNEGIEAFLARRAPVWTNA